MGKIHILIQYNGLMVAPTRSLRLNSESEFDVFQSHVAQGSHATLGAFLERRLALTTASLTLRIHHNNSSDRINISSITNSHDRRKIFTPHDPPQRLQRPRELFLLIVYNQFGDLKNDSLHVPPQQFRIPKRRPMPFFPHNPPQQFQRLGENRRRSKQKEFSSVH